MSAMTDTTPAVPTATARPGLAAVLLVDAATCVAMGALLLTLTQPIAALLGLPAALLTWAGALLLACAVPMFLAGRRRPPSSGLVILIVAGNLAWVLASLTVAFGFEGISPAGYAFVVAQALAVLALAALEWRGLVARRR